MTKRSTRKKKAIKYADYVLSKASVSCKSSIDWGLDAVVSGVYKSVAQNVHYIVYADEKISEINYTPHLLIDKTRGIS